MSISVRVNGQRVEIEACQANLHRLAQAVGSQRAASCGDIKIQVPRSMVSKLSSGAENVVEKAHTISAGDNSQIKDELGEKTGNRVSADVRVGSYTAVEGDDLVTVRVYENPASVDEQVHNELAGLNIVEDDVLGTGIFEFENGGYWVVVEDEQGKQSFLLSDDVSEADREMFDAQFAKIYLTEQMEAELLDQEAADAVREETPDPDSDAIRIAMMKQNLGEVDGDVTAKSAGGNGGGLGQLFRKKEDEKTMEVGG